MPKPDLSPIEPYEVSFNRYGRELYKFGGRDFKILLGPGVYCVRTAEEFLYVGSAKNVFGRVSDSDHAAIQQALEVGGCQVWIIAAKSEAHARHLESWLIAENQPRFNKKGKSRSSSAYKSISEWFDSFDLDGVEGIKREVG